MQPEDFRRFALAVPNATEQTHQRHPDFRIGKRIFATLGYPDAGHAMVKLGPDEQQMLVAAEPSIFAPANGAWGRQGSTLVRLTNADEATLRSALAMAAARLR